MPSPLRDNTALSRFELDAGGVTAFMKYRLNGGVLTLDHTETPVEARGRGIASRLVKGVLDEARRRGPKIVPRCPFVSAYLAKHPEFRPGGVSGPPGLLRRCTPRNDEIICPCNGDVILTFVTDIATYAKLTRKGRF